MGSGVLGAGLGEGGGEFVGGEEELEERDGGGEDEFGLRHRKASGIRDGLHAKKEKGRDG